ncbi:hypothetical protein BPAE_0003g00760 [Botrytis paeoniae]|uniref:Uncharacterized protein n=1 Tax=Botrytis paeoniae TaxID=278948 RepID=A0A4Z1G9I5_9HELO|nr:hypothetical protein BPAE_0003g00760 [Botrytis paeoniae]
MGWDEIGSGWAGQAIGNVAELINSPLIPGKMSNVKRQVLKSVEFSSSSKERALDSVMVMVRRF